MHEVELAAYRIQRYAVSNGQFAEFVGATGWRTDAERFKWSFVFGGLLPDDFPPTRGVEGAPWWRQVMGADWSHPEGPHSDLSERQDHPVVHVSWNDAQAYCAWTGTRLPTEAEWEVAARGGRVGAPFPWGNELEPDGRHQMNVFQGEFPGGNTAADGYLGTAPVDAFEPNGFGLHNVCGNVWEWCADWLDLEYYRTAPERRTRRTEVWLVAGPTGRVLPVPRLILSSLPGVGPLWQRTRQLKWQRGIPGRQRFLGRRKELRALVATSPAPPLSCLARQNSRVRPGLDVLTRGNRPLWVMVTNPISATVDAWPK